MDSASSGRRVMRIAGRVRCPLFTLLACFAVVTSAVASDARAVRPVPVTANRVTIDDAFWSPKLKTWRTVTIKDCLDKFERDGAFRNFDHVARGELDAPHGGPPWYDGLIYEVIRGAADLMAQEPDPALKARIDGYIDRISAAAARDPDGYINPPIRKCTRETRPPLGPEWRQRPRAARPVQHRLPALVEAGIHYYGSTGKTKLLATAVRAANGMVAVMGPPPPRKNIIPGRGFRARNHSSAFTNCSGSVLSSSETWSVRVDETALSRPRAALDRCSRPP